MCRQNRGMSRDVPANYLGRRGTAPLQAHGQVRHAGWLLPMARKGTSWNSVVDCDVPVQPTTKCVQCSVSFGITRPFSLVDQVFSSAGRPHKLVGLRLVFSMRCPKRPAYVQRLKYVEHPDRNEPALARDSKFDSHNVPMIPA